MLERKTYTFSVPTRLIILLGVIAVSFSGCCSKKKLPPTSVGGLRTNKAVAIKKNLDKKAGKQPTISVPLALLENTGLEFAISANNSKAKTKRKASGFFAEKYVKGMELMSAKKFDDAEKLFEDIGNRTSNPEEASIAQLCIAEIYFRNKSNTMALQIYEQIVQKYPKTQAAENAKAGIEYLTSFGKYEKDYISPDVEDQKRRGY